MTIFNDNTLPSGRQADDGQSILFDELSQVFDCLPWPRLVAKLQLERWIGRSGYSIQMMLKAYLASYFLNMRNTNALIRRLQEDRTLRELCGFTKAKQLPNRRTFNRFLDRLELHQDLIQWCINNMLTELREILPDFGSLVAVDATDVHSHSDCDKIAVSDSEAGFVIKEGTTGGRKKWAWGYKLHLVADAAYELPIAMSFTPGNHREMAEMMPLLRATKARLSWFSPRYIIADKGYDDYKNFEGVVKEFDADPIIKARMETPIFGTPAQPFCVAKLPLVYRCWDKNKGLQYQCPERARKATCPLPEKCSLKTVWVRPVQDYRRFGYRVPRHTEDWDIIYTYRVGIERIFSRLKGQRRLDAHCFRGLKKIELHCTLAMLCLVVGALAKARSHQVDELRDCARRVP